MSAILSTSLLMIQIIPATSQIAQQNSPGIPWWFWVIMGVALIVLVWMLFNRPREEESENEPQPIAAIPEPEKTSISTEAFEIGESSVPFREEAIASFIDEEPETGEPAPAPFVDFFDTGNDNGPVTDDFVVPKDDLTLVEGIGPKINKLLNKADIFTFEQLAATNIEKLQVILASSGIFLTDPSTWPEQAQLAAAGRWTELQSLQEELKGSHPTEE